MIGSLSGERWAHHDNGTKPVSGASTEHDQPQPTAEEPPQPPWPWPDPSVRRQIVARLRSGEPVAAVVVDTNICQATLFDWKRQALIDAGVIESAPSVEADELATAHKRIGQLEARAGLDPGCLRIVR